MATAIQRVPSSINFAAPAMKGKLINSKNFTISAISDQAKEGKNLQATIQNNRGKAAIISGAASAVLAGGSVAAFLLLNTLTAGIALAVIASLALVFAIYQAVQKKLSSMDIELLPEEEEEVAAPFVEEEVTPPVEAPKEEEPTTLVAPIVIEASKPQETAAPQKPFPWKTVAAATVVLASIGAATYTYGSQTVGAIRSLAPFLMRS
jgi:hypothetical protein